MNKVGGVEFLSAQGIKQGAQLKIPKEIPTNIQIIKPTGPSHEGNGRGAENRDPARGARTAKRNFNSADMGSLPHFKEVDAQSM